MRKFLVLCGIVVGTICSISAQETPEVLNRPLKYIKYMSVDARLGYGIGKPTLVSDNNWTVRASVVSFFGLGYNYMHKNNWGVDVQINEEIGTFTFGNEGPEFKSGYSTTGIEIGGKKTLLRKPDDTFFIRAAFGFNFLVIANDNNSNDFYSYSTSASGSNMYVMPELGYQLRFPSGNHIIDFSVGYKHSLSEVASTYMIFTDKGTKSEENTAKMSGSFIGINLRYSFLFKGFEKKDETKRKIEDHF